MKTKYSAFGLNPVGVILVSEHSESEHRRKGTIQERAELLWQFEADTPEQAEAEHLRRLADWKRE